MLHLPICSRGLALCAREHRLLEDAWSTDLGYQVHSLLARLLGSRAPRPFEIEAGDSGRMHVLAYAPASLAALQMAADGGGDTAALEAVAWDTAASKEMPGFVAGQRLGFRVRVCPAVRVGRHHPLFRHGAEVDPWLVAAKRDAGSAPPLREAVYCDWLAARLLPGAALQAAQILSMRDARLWRRGEPREGDTMHGRPRRNRMKNGRAPVGRREVVFKGTLVVSDPDTFAALLARGVGRHRAFGFGMLLLGLPDGPKA